MQHDGGSSQLEIIIHDKTYRSANAAPVPVIRGLRLSIASGSFTAILGPSGCGKSTLLKIISGIDKDYDGALRWREPPLIGVVFQEPRLLPWRTVCQNIELTRSKGLTGEELERLHAEWGVADLLDRFPGELSLGQARRVSLARAYASQPNVMLLDEPFVSLDEPAAVRLRQLLLNVWQSRPVTTLLVTHNLNEALELAERVVLLAPRPTSVVADVALDTATKNRHPEEVGRMRRQLQSRYPDFFTSDA